MPFFVKEAGILSSANEGVKSILGAGFKSLLPVSKTAPIGEKIMGYGAKGLAGYGAFKVFRNNVSREPTPYDYTFMQRNRILAGEVKPEEIAGDELQRIKALGMKFD